MLLPQKRKIHKMPVQTVNYKKKKIRKPIISFVKLEIEVSILINQSRLFMRTKLSEYIF